MGPFPVAACCAMKPRNAIIARRAFLISFSRQSATDSLEPLARPRGSKGPPG